MALHPEWLRGIRSAARERSALPMGEYLESIRFEVEGKLWQEELTPFLSEPIQALQDESVRQVVVPCPVKTGKTAMIEAFLVWKARENPGRVCSFLNGRDARNEWIDTRLSSQLLRHCENLIRKKTKTLVNFADGSWFSFLSGLNRNDLQMRDAETVVADEPAQYPEGHLDEISARTTTYDKTTAKRVFIGDARGNVHRLRR